MADFTFYGICNKCGYVFKSGEVSTTSVYVCPKCGKVYTPGTPVGKSSTTTTQG